MADVESSVESKGASFDVCWCYTHLQKEKKSNKTLWACVINLWKISISLVKRVCDKEIFDKKEKIEKKKKISTNVLIVIVSPLVYEVLNE